MSRFEHSTTIARPPLEVWTYAVDILRHPDWMSADAAAITSGSGTEVGSRGRERLLFGPFKWDMEFSVVEAEPGRSVVWRTIDDPRMVLEVGLFLEPVEPASSLATYRSVVQLRGLWRLLAPLVSMEGSPGVRRELGKLKDQVEAAPAIADAG